MLKIPTIAITIITEVYIKSTMEVSNPSVVDNIEKVTLIALFKKWIITILINKCNRIYRRKYKTDLSYEELNFEDFITATSNDVESDLEFYELLKDLKYEERIILILYYKEEYTVKEIKSILNMKVSTINTHLFRARAKLKEKLEKGGELHG